MQQGAMIYEQAANLVMDYPNNHTVKFETPKDEIVSLLNDFKEKFAPEVLKSLSDDELFSAVLDRTESKVDKYENISDGVKSLSGVQRIFYVSSYYEMEVMNGGLCQFFVNSSRDVAPELSECLDAIGADEHKKLFDSFIKDNNIDVHDLSSFIIDDVSEFETQNNRYPFDEFDNAFYELKPIQDLLIPYIKEHISEF